MNALKANTGSETAAQKAIKGLGTQVSVQEGTAEKKTFDFSEATVSVLQGKKENQITITVEGVTKDGKPVANWNTNEFAGKNAKANKQAIQVAVKVLLGNVEVVMVKKT